MNDFAGLPDCYSYNRISEQMFRINLKTKEEVEQWMSEYQMMSKTSWTIKNTIQNSIEKAKKNIFKRYYQCHFNTRQTRLVDVSTRKRIYPSKNIDCPAQIIIAINRDPTQYSRASDKTQHSLIKNWPCLVTIKNNHNHTITSAVALSKRPISDTTIQEILEYFTRGHSVASGFHSFCLSKMEEYGDKYQELMADRHFFPKKKDFSNIWQKHFKATFGSRSGKDALEVLEKNLSNTDTLFKIQQIDDHYTVSLCTPMMQRAAKLLIQASEIMFVDATGNCDVENHKLFFFVTQSSGGGIPIGCVITTSEKVQVFEVAVKNLIDIMPTKLTPKVIITDDDLKERKVLEMFWPTSTLLLCTFHVLKAVWKWLCTSTNQIAHEDRQQMYRSFKNVLQSSESESQVEDSITILFEDCKRYPLFITYIKKLIKRKHMWCIYYRKQFLTRGSNTNNMIEVIFRLFKDIPLERTKAYNLVQLVDFIVVSFSMYYKQRLLDLVLNKINIKRYAPDEKDVDLNNINKTGHLQYTVLSSDKKEVYFIDMEICMCSCPQGQSGKICKHQAGVIKKFNIDSACNVLSKQQRKILYEIATGSEPPSHLLQPLLLENTPNGFQLDKNEINSQSNNEIKSQSNLVVDNTVDETSVTDVEISGTVTLNDDNIDNSNTELLSQWKKFITDLDNKVISNLKDDPENFQGGVKACIQNYVKNMNSSSSLLSGLYTAFKPCYALKRQMVHTRRKGVKISVQPTSMARRKTKFTGRRRFQSGRKPDGHIRKNENLAPHSLETCVKQNRALGARKIAK